MLKMLKRIDYRLWIYIAFFVSSIILAVFVYDVSYVRLWQSIKNLGTSAAYYFCEVFRLDVIVESDITQLISIDISEFLPFSIDEMLYKLENLFPALFKWEHFSLYLLYSLSLTQIFLLISPIVVLLLYVLWKLIASAYIKNTNKKGESKALVTYLLKVRPKLQKVSEWIFDVIDFGKKHKLFPVLTIIVWVMNLNVAAIALSARRASEISILPKFLVQNTNLKLLLQKFLL